MKVQYYEDEISFYTKLKRMIWIIVWGVFVRPIPRRFLNSWKIFILRKFGATIHNTAVIYSSAKIYMPWNLEMHENSCLASNVDCYNVDRIIIKSNSTVSQKAYLCTASHSITDKKFQLVTAPIIIQDQAWIGASAFISMGVTIGQGAVVGATSSVYKNVDSWAVVGGNPAKFIKKRVIND
jgi:putative colanic acid biosynthesis acetyltransferase WcaF